MIIAVADYAEAEGRSLRRAVARLGGGLALVGLAAAFAGVGLALCLWALYQGLVPAVGQPLASLITGLACLIAAGAFAWVTRILVR